jgi:hypothetical protein
MTQFWTAYFLLEMHKIWITIQKLYVHIYSDIRSICSDTFPWNFQCWRKWTVWLSTRNQARDCYCVDQAASVQAWRLVAMSFRTSLLRHCHYKELNSILYCLLWRFVTITAPLSSSFLSLYRRGERHVTRKKAPTKEHYIIYINVIT